MKPIYYPDHDKRYAHIHPLDRWKYPDEIRFKYRSSIKRVKLFKELTVEEVVNSGVSACLLAKDVPYTKGLFRP